ncbi:hypothetical protein TRFO_28228 [Tritrichomonas foetus]|uniref:HECT domain-containing protein n=1 Tax=Tritrichomonas foetus TaxID=1144522 RepID=A0A1J4K3G9_9EUKA|nr:hypothetical protein TRFO_28228 [Tritrichomonas foetus]|eukprot:OHT04292.1 hypothetical protein TRFO_28228 [Tritrichomonas foetus]
MGGSSSQVNQVSFDTFFNSNDKPIFVILPEELVLKQLFSPSHNEISFYQKKSNYGMKAMTIIDILMNYSILTQEKSQFEAFKKIIIPNFSQSLLTDNQNFIYSKLLFDYHQSLNDLFNEKNKDFIENLIMKENKIPILNEQLNNSLMDFGIESIQQFQGVIKKVYKNNSISFKFTKKSFKSDKIITFLESNQNNAQLLMYSFVWGLHINDLKLILLSLKFMTDCNVSMKKSHLEKPFRFEYNDSPELIFSISRQLCRGYINFNSFTLPNKYISPIIAANPFYLLAFNFRDSSYELLKIRISNNNINDDSQRFSTIELPLYLKKSCSIACLNNTLVLVNKNGKIFLGSIEPFFINRQRAKILPARSPKFRLPFSSDGKFIYSLVSTSEVAVFKTSIESNSLVYIHSIKLKLGHSALLEPCNKELLPKSFFTNASMISNGIVIEFIYPLNFGSDQWHHLIRSFSVITGKHIGDHLASLPYKIDSLCYDPFSKYLWSLSVHNDGVCFIKFDFTGSDPPWISNFRLNHHNNDTKPPETIDSYKSYAINYLHSVFCPFLGSSFSHHEYLNDFFTCCSGSKIIDLILSMIESDNLILNQILLFLLCIQIRTVKMNKDQETKLLNILQSLTENPTIYLFVFHFIISICNSINKNNVAHYFSKLQLTKNHLDPCLLLFTLSRLENTKNFSYIFNSDNLSLSTIFSQLRYAKSQTDIPIELHEFILGYQASLFRSLSINMKENPQKLTRIENNVFFYTSLVFENMFLFLVDAKSISDLEKSIFFNFFSRFMVLINIEIVSSKISRLLLPIISQMFSQCTEKIAEFHNNLNFFYFFFNELFFLWVRCFKQIITFSDLELFQRYEQFLDIKMEKEKALNDIFNNSLTNDDFSKLIELFYKKVMNPINKRLTKDDLDLEKLILLAMIYQLNFQNTIIAFHKNSNKENEPVPNEIRQIMQSIYKIRSNLRSKKQSVEDPNLFISMRKNIVEKCHFLLQCESTNTNNSNFSDKLKEKTDFLNNCIQISDIIFVQSQLSDIKSSLSMFIQIASSVFKMDLPLEFLYSFMMYICKDLNILSSFEVLSKYVDIDQDLTLSFILYLMELIGKMPSNAIITFICILVLMTTYTSKGTQNFIFRVINCCFAKFCSQSHAIKKTEFKSTLTFLCYFIRILSDEKIIKNFTEFGNAQITKNLKSLYLLNSLSFTTAHSLLHSNLISLNEQPDPLKFIGVISQPKYHSLSLLLYERIMHIEDADYLKGYVASILDLIGSVFCGECSELFSIVPPVQSIYKSSNSCFIRTPLCQISGALELVQVIRRVIQEKSTFQSAVISLYFSDLSQINVFKDEILIKQTSAMLVILSNIIEIQRQSTIAMNVTENKSYFVTKVNQIENNITGFLLPIEDHMINHSFSISKDIKANELIPFSLSQFTNIEVPYLLFNTAIKMSMEKYSDCLISFLALQCIRTNILDSELGADFSSILLKSLGKSNVNRFEFRSNAPFVISLLIKSLINPTKGIFVGSPVKPIFFHTSFTKMVFENDYILTESQMISNIGVNIFISSILDDINAVFFLIKMNAQSYFNFGIVTHSVDQNQSLSVTYSSNQQAFFINGEKSLSYNLENDLFVECRYLPSKNKVSFASSSKQKRLFSCKLPENSRCSFICLLYPYSTVNYKCSFDPETDCFQKKVHLNQIVTPLKFIKRLGNTILQTNAPKNIKNITKFSMIINTEKDDEKEEIITYNKNVIKYISNSQYEIISNIENEQSYRPSFAKIDLRETAVKFDEFPNSSFVSQIADIYSSPIQLRKYLLVDEISGRFDVIPSDSAIINKNHIIPPFHYKLFSHLPAEVINCYFSGACDKYRQEVLTLLSSRILVNIDVPFVMHHFSITLKMIVNFVTSVLLLLEPIKFSNLYEKKSPIDFENFNSFESCSHTELYDYYSGLNKILDYFKPGKNAQNTNFSKQFVEMWYNKLEKDFSNKYMHFVHQRNSNTIIVGQSIQNTYQTFLEENAIGWIILPICFGQTKLPNFHANNLIFPSMITDNVSYAFSSGEFLRIIAPTQTITKFALIPVFENSNEPLLFSFFNLVVSFKYFVLFTQIPSINRCINDYSTQIRSFVFNSIVACSPFFYSHADAVLSFLMSKVPVKFDADYISKLNLFIVTSKLLRKEAIDRFIHEQLSDYEDIKASIYKYYVDDSTPPDHKSLPDSVFPSIITSYTSISTINYLFIYTKKVLTSKQSAFPFYLLLTEYAEFFSQYPPCEISFLEGNNNQISIHFLSYIPKSIQLFDPDIDNNMNVLVSSSPNFQKSSQFKIKNIAISNLVNMEQTIYVSFPGFENIKQHNLIVCSNTAPISKADLIYEHRHFFRNDLMKWCTEFSNREDQMILIKLRIDPLMNSTDTRISPSLISTMNTRQHYAHLVALRAKILLILNSICIIHKTLMEKSDFHEVQSFISPIISGYRFYNHIISRSNNGKIYLRIDRQEGLKVRNGVSRDYSKSMIAQFSSYYISHISESRGKEQPLHIEFKNENGIDVGGLMRDFVSELIRDINEPKVGLFIKTPNGRNHCGNYQDCIIPVPDPSINKSSNYYRAVGGLIAIGIRTKMQQPQLMFPQLFWDFLITGNISITNIFDIDEDYRNQINSLLTASKEMENKQFENLVANFVVLNARGNILRVNNFKKITKENYERYITLCHQARINEILRPLEIIRSGFWDNLGIYQPGYVTPQLLEFLVCGDRTINLDDFKRITKFSLVPLRQQRYFFESISLMTNDQKRKLLQFSTGLPSITENGLRVDYVECNADSRLPSASTCFYRLHLPTYSSTEKMYQSLIYAISEAGTFENS